MSTKSSRAALRDQLRESGYCLMRGLMGAQAARQEAKDLLARKDEAFSFSRMVNMWNENPARFTKEADKKILKDQGMNKVGRTFDYLLLNKSGPLVRLFESEQMLKLANELYQRSSDEKPLHRAKDELGRCTGLLLQKQQALPWQFTSSSLTAFLFLQASDQPDLVQVIPRAHERVKEQDEKFLDTLTDIVELLGVELHVSTLDMPITWEQLLEDLDPECGPDVESMRKEVQSMQVKEGDVLFVRGSSALLRELSPPFFPLFFPSFLPLLSSSLLSSLSILPPFSPPSPSFLPLLSFCFLPPLTCSRDSHCGRDSASRRLPELRGGCGEGAGVEAEGEGVRAMA